MDITFPAFLSRLPDSSPDDKTDYLITLEALAQLSVEKSISDILVRRLINRLDVILQAGGSLAYPQAVLSTLIFVLSRRDLKTDTNLGFYHEKLVVNLAHRVAHGSIDLARSTALNEEGTLGILGRLINLVVRALDDHKQSSVALQVYTLFADDTLWKPVPYRSVVPGAQRMTMILSTSLMAAIKPEVSPHLSLLVKILMKIDTSCAQLRRNWHCPLTRAQKSCNHRINPFGPPGYPPPNRPYD